MLFAKKKNLRFDEMEHIESPNLSELEATLDFLKKTPEKKEESDSGAVLHPMPAIEPPKIDPDKNKADDPSAVSQDIAFDDDTSSDAAEADDAPSADISEEILKKAESLREKQLLNDSVNNEAELALKKDEANVTKTSDENDNLPPKEVSDAVKAAMALQAEYDAKKKDLPQEDPRRSRFMRGRAYPVKKAEESEKVQTENAQSEDSQTENDPDENEKNDSAQNVEVADKPEESATEKTAENPAEAELKTEKEESSDTVPVVNDEEKEVSDSTADQDEASPDEDTKKAEDTEEAEEAEGIKSGEDKEDDVSSELSQDEKSEERSDDKDAEETAEKADVDIKEESEKEPEKAAESKPVPVRKGATTAITSNLKLPNDVIVSNIESSARSMGRFAGAAKIANPLPHPKKHITRNMDFDYPVPATQMHFDIEDLNGMDFFDIDD